MNFTATPLNAVIGDAGFLAHFGRKPTRHDTEVARIDSHLDFVLRKLIDADTSHLGASQRHHRAACIQHLQNYRIQRTYPGNTFIAERTPVFIDQSGRLCAVGYLIAQTMGIEHAQLISANHQLDRIEDIDPELFTDWAEIHGLDVIELAMIQPSYGHVDPEAANSFVTGVALALPFAAAAVFWLHGSFEDDRENRIVRLGIGFMVALGAGVAGMAALEMLTHNHQWTKSIEWIWWISRIGFGGMVSLSSWRLLQWDSEVDEVGPRLVRWSFVVLSVVGVQTVFLPATRDCHGKAKEYTYVGAVVPFVVPFVSPYTAPPPKFEPSSDSTKNSGIGFVEGCYPPPLVINF